MITTHKEEMIVLYNELISKYPAMDIKLNEPLSQYSYTKVGGKADALVFPQTKQEVQQMIEWVETNQVPLTILGNLSNLIVMDGGIRGVVMILTRMNQIQVEGETVIADAGASLIETTQVARDHHLTGLEFACGIPGSVGGAIFMNAGAYGGEIKDLPLEIETLTRTGEFRTYSTQTAQFGYRHSIFQDNHEVVLQVKFQLEPGEIDLIQSEMDRLTELRTSKQPLELPSCGSVFKRPEGHFTGKLIQDAGLQGYRIGGAEISKKHAGFIVNVDHATATDYIELIQFIQHRIWELYQVQLEPEVRIIGEAIPADA
ncbi:UDP-N-acetylmuramate dehydrogenase [Falseniella ignava]|uniref:UDP-N-acetylenolpyruvoylglucosamine reductase n=1 Tax=Falseniella ignava CCUG 37419 TaxID=883112 RepID=K1LNU0_9LACT|nr:UDP-N-acetylmuramate dehydrogenase [Falseniella ignava]EKB58610.1 UDP-N-acetylenolpyruvoylglucosamine reductase [Falseniella ignava CCUG 37419]